MSTSTKFPVKGPHQTNWNIDPAAPIKHEKRAHMMGEGLGSSLGIEGPKGNPGKPYGWYDEQKRLEKVESRERSMKLGGRKSFAKYIEWKYKTELLPQKIANGECLVNQRIFLATWVNPKWDVKAKNIGMPEGVDVAHSEFGELLLVPVLEEEQAKRMGINPKIEPPLRDVEGRPCWVAASIKERIEAIFGYIKWTRPLTIKEAEQFGVKI